MVLSSNQGGNLNFGQKKEWPRCGNTRRAYALGADFSVSLSTVRFRALSLRPLLMVNGHYISIEPCISEHGCIRYKVLPETIGLVCITEHSITSAWWKVKLLFRFSFSFLPFFIKISKISRMVSLHFEPHAALYEKRKKKTDIRKRNSIFSFHFFLFSFTSPEHDIRHEAPAAVSDEWRTRPAPRRPARGSHSSLGLGRTWSLAAERPADLYDFYRQYTTCAHRPINLTSSYTPPG